MKRNWEIKTGLFAKIKNLYRKGGFNPRFYYYRYCFNTYPNKHRVAKYPFDVIAETANICNLRCSMCFQSDAALSISKTSQISLMPMATFKKIADECAKCRVPALKLSWRGEPMLNDNFTEMIRYSKSVGILEVTSLTNATLMNERISNEIVKAKLDQLIISVDGFSKETYEKIRVGADYNVVLSNIETLVRIRGKSRKPFIRIQYTESDINRHETDEFYKYWKKMVDEVSISYCQEFGSPKKDDSNNVPVHKFFCKQPFQRLVIMADGTVGVCATDVTGFISLGNINNSSIGDIWNSPEIERVREQHKSGNYHFNPMCRICAHNVYRANQNAHRRS